MDSESQQIKYYRHDPVLPAEANVLLIHGLGEHAARYDEWIARFTGTGVGFRSFDLPGHGLSGGRRGVMPHFSAVYDIIDSELASIREEYPKLPLFLYGHSLGGTIVLGYLADRATIADGAIVTSPWIRLSVQPSPVKVAVTRFMNKVMPSLTLPSGLDSMYLSHDPDVVRKYNDDPLVHGLISPRLFCEAENAADAILTKGALIKIPVLVAHGREDMITSPSGSIEVASVVPYSILKLWDGCYHELHNEMIKDDHFALIREWIANVS